MKSDFKTKALPFDEAIKFFRNKVPISDEEYKYLETETKKRAFSVAKITRLDILQDLLNELRKALETGETLQTFQKSVNQKMQDKGWKGLTPFRLDTIFRTNIQTAYMTGRYKQMKSPDVVSERPYWLYSAVNDSATRPSHMAMNGIIRRFDDPIWEEWYPPNGFRCRCKVIALSKEAAQRRGLKVDQGQTDEYIDKNTGEILSLTPDKGFNHKPGVDDWSPDLTKYDNDVKKMF